MSRFVRVVEIVTISDGDAEALRRRITELPPRVSGTVVTTGAGLQVTLTTRYRPVPGSHRRSVRMLQKHLNGVLSG